MILHGTQLTNARMALIMQSLKNMQQSIKYLEIPGNCLGGRGFKSLLATMPRDLEILLIGNNRLKNSDLRALSSTVRVT